MEMIRISKKELGPYVSKYVDYDGTHPKWVGRRCAFLPGHGTTLFVEGVHFIVEDDNSHLPVLEKSNAEVGLAYQGAGNGIVFVQNLYRLTVEQARADGFVYLDRVTASNGDYALPGSDTVKSVK